MKILNALLVCIFILGAAVHPLEASGATELSKEQKKYMLQDLDSIYHLFQVCYAPAEWKKEKLGWDLDQEYRKLRERIEGHRSLSTKQFQQLIKGFCNGVHDYHVSASFYSTEYASLPINIQRSGDRYFISYVCPECAPEMGLSLLCVGDEVLAIDKRPIASVVEELRRKEIGDNVRGTDLALATMYLTKRLGSMGHTVPRGEVVLKVLSKESGKITSYTTEWDYYQEEVGDPFAHRMAKNLFSKGQAREDFYHKPFLSPHFARLQESMPKHHACLNYFGARDGCFPPFGEILWENPPENAFQAYLFRLPTGVTAGYLRIPSYNVDNEDAVVAEFEEVIEKMEAEASVLVIDQMNNPGGVLLYLYALISRLTPYPLYVPNQRIMLTQADVLSALEEIDFFEGIPDDETAREVVGESLLGVDVTRKVTDGLVDFFQRVVHNWERGKRLTDALYMYGFESIEPHPKVEYTKPILLIINHLDFSAADFFAAIMQDNKRATLIGTRTAGAGGFVEKLSIPNLTGIRHIDLTGSFSERINGKPIENLGVEPDIPYEFTISDLQNQYADFKTKVLNELKCMIEK